MPRAAERKLRGHKAAAGRSLWKHKLMYVKKHAPNTQSRTTQWAQHLQNTAGSDPSLVAAKNQIVTMASSAASTVTQPWPPIPISHLTHYCNCQKHTTPGEATTVTDMCSELVYKRLNPSG